MNRAGWYKTSTRGCERERFTGMQDPTLVIGDKRIKEITRIACRSSSPPLRSVPPTGGYELTERQAGDLVIDTSTLPDLTEHPDPRAQMMLDAIMRVSCSSELPPQPTDLPQQLLALRTA